MASYPDPSLTFSIQDIGIDRHGFVADPFYLTTNDAEYVLFELLLKEPIDKMIGCAEIIYEDHWEFRGIAVEDPSLVLSFPFPFEFRGSHYMFPSIGSAHDETEHLRIYEAEALPLDWTVLTELPFAGSDPVIFEDGERWYLVCTTRGETRLFHSENPIDPIWHEHAESPVSTLDRISRMGGRPVQENGTTYLFYQDCGYHYGEKVRCFEVTELSATSFEQREIDASPITCGQYNGQWNQLGMHHVDFDIERGRALVDGHTAARWTIAELPTGNDIHRLMPSPDEFTFRQRLRRKRQLARDRLKVLERASAYRAEHGNISLVRRALRQIV